MSKKPFRGKPRPAKAPGANPGNLMSQFQKMQEEMAQTQEKLADETLTVTSGGGAVTVVITGHQRVQAITLNPEVVDPAEVEMLQDMLVAAVNQAIEQSQAMAAQKMEGLTGNMNLGGLLGGLGGL
jgi:DNA-binding YbaB/EbfC family protein